MRQRYWLTQLGPNFSEWDIVKVDAHVRRSEPVFTGNRAECQAWIDREAARACLLALPVSEGVVSAMMDAYVATDYESDPCSAEFTAAIRAIAGGAA